MYFIRMHKLKGGVAVSAENAWTQVTKQTVKMAADEALNKNIDYLVIASNTGGSALELVEAAKESFKGKGVPHMVCVTHCVGYAADGVDEMTPEIRKALADAGVSVLTSTHLMGGIERAMGDTWKGVYPLGIVANTLKLFGQGTKVAVEIAVMALDSGLIPHGEDVISIGGSGRGADTALVLRPAHALRFFNTKVKSIICKKA
jgi:hypothetical protein